jgi:rubrerythrin
MKHDQQSEAIQGRISPYMSVHDALRTAIAFEQSAQAFYRELADQVHPEARPLLLDLADEERKHAKLLEDISTAERLSYTLSQQHKIPPTQPRLDEFIHLRKLSAGASEDEILDYVESRERIAFEHYGYLAELTPPGPLQQLFAFLREEERRHESEIQSRWSATFNVY